ncbi:MAG: M1 family aminopeptidase [Gemmataceae bacterium]
MTSLGLLALLFFLNGSTTGELPAYLPRYDLVIDLDVKNRQAQVQQVATWTNPHETPTDRVVLVAHARYVVPEKEIGFTAKTLEILRVRPSEAMGIVAPPLKLHALRVEGQSARYTVEGDTQTTLVVPLGRPLGKGQSIRLTLDFTLDLPAKMGRWGQWDGITTLSNWLPIFAYYGPEVNRFEVRPDGAKWQPTNFIAWHQPFFNEAGIYSVRLTVDGDQKVVATGKIFDRKTSPEGRQVLHIHACGVREFSLFCSSKYCFHEADVPAGPDGSMVRVRTAVSPRNVFYGKKCVEFASHALLCYSRWLGPYPYPELTVAESYFGWNGNECSTIVMLDERVLGMPQVAQEYVDYLLTHEVAHQYWYNLVGTNGFSETWMDEAMANHLCQRVMTEKYGKNNALMTYPKWLDWLPKIHRDDFRSSGMYGTFGRGENTAILQELNGFGHLITLFNMCYDKGSRVMAMIENRMGGERFFYDFLRLIVSKYRYRILRVADFRRELEAYTGSTPKRCGQCWADFFENWLCKEGLSDWSVENVTLTKPPKCVNESYERCFLKRRLLLCRGACPENDLPTDGVRVEVIVHQRQEYDEPTQLGLELPNCQGYPIRIPILPHLSIYTICEPPARVTRLENGPKGGVRMKIEVVLPAEPTQIAIDPDQNLIDANPANNYWHTPIRWRLTPLYTFLEETDLTNAYDRWNIIAGPWLFTPPYQDPWFTRSTMAGARLGAYRTQQFVGGAYIGFRTDFRDVVAGVDGMWDHWPQPTMQSGVIAERRLAEVQRGDPNAFRAVAWTRYIFLYSPSLYLPPAHFVEGFVKYSDNFLPFPAERVPTGVRYDRTTTAGLHYRINYLTPYWDPEGGFQFDAWYEGGIAAQPSTVMVQKLSGQFSSVHFPPDLRPWFAEGSLAQKISGWLADTRFALRLFGATSMPSRGEFFTLGGADLFRGFDMRERQGSMVYVGSVEWRVPLVQAVKWDCCDHMIGLRSAYLAAFYDVGNAFTSGRSVGSMVHAVGLGLRADVAWFSFVERTTLRLDIAQTLNSSRGVQAWIGVNHPF